MADGNGFTRRRLLRAGALGTLTAVAGCSNGPSGSGSGSLGGEDPATYTLTVELVGESGEPIHEASVAVQSRQLVSQAEAKVPGPDGILTFELEEGEYVVVVESQEYTNVEEPVTVDGGDREVTITLQRGFG